MIRPISRRSALSQLSATAAALTVAGCSRSAARAKGSIRIGTAQGSFNLTMTELIKQQGYLKYFGLDPEFVPVSDGAKIMASVISGSVDIVPISGFAQVFPAIERGAPIRLINAATLRPQLALFSGKSDIRELKDLEGRTVGVGAVGSLIYQLTVASLRKYSVDISKVRFMNLGSNTDVFKGVRTGTVDAGAGPAAYVDIAADYDVHPIEHGNFSVELPNFTYQAGWTSTHAIATLRDELVHTLAAYGKLFRFLSTPAAHDAFIAARKSVFPTASHRENEAEWAFLQSGHLLATDLILSPERVEYMQKMNLAFHEQKSILPFSRVVDPSIASKALSLINS